MTDTAPAIPQSATDAGTVTPRQRRLALVAVLSATVMGALDTMIVNVALPTIAADLGAKAADAVWIVSVYQIIVAIVLLPIGAGADVLSSKRVFVASVAVFTVASVACAFADTLAELVAARALQGLGGGGILSLNVVLVRRIYPDRLLGRGLGHAALAVATSLSLGPVVASTVLTFGPWPWLFLINIPVGVVSMVGGLLFLPGGRRSVGQFDPCSAVLAAGLAGFLVFGIDGLAYGTPPPRALLQLALSIVCGVLLAIRQADHPAPMVPFDLLGRPMFSLSAATATCAFAVQGLAFVCLPFLLQDIFRKTQAESGFLMTAWPVAVAAMAPIAGYFTLRFSAALLCSVGLVVLSAGMLVMALSPAGTHAILLGCAMTVCGVGFGLFQTPNVTAIMLSAPMERSGSAGGFIAVSRQVGLAIGAALAALFFRGAGSQAAPEALLLGAAIALFGSGLSFLRRFARH